MMGRRSQYLATGLTYPERVRRAKMWKWAWTLEQRIRKYQDRMRTKTRPPMQIETIKIHPFLLPLIPLLIRRPNRS